MPRFTDTIAALATPAGRSAIALVRISGPETPRIAEEILGAVPPPRQATHADYRDRSGATVDDVLFTFFPSTGSYTGEDALEIACHGNPLIAQKILEDLLGRGCRGAAPGEFTQRAFLNGKMDLSQAEAVADLIHARSERALAAANQQLRGSVGRRMQDLTDRLLGIIAHVEAYIDFPDEDLPPEDVSKLAESIRALSTDTQRLLATSRYGELLREGIKTVIIGPPNAGKSSLLNRLVGSERAIVSPEPGTTRDFIEEPIMVGPHWLRLIDTAGLNPAPGAIERLGIERSVERLKEADLVLLVLDAEELSAPLPAEIRDGNLDRTILLVINKIDIYPNFQIPSPLSQFRTFAVSAKTGTGISQLENGIVESVDATQSTTEEDLVVINARHADALQRARTGLDEAADKLRNHSPVELMASDLRGTLAAYGEIVGKIDNERMLDRLFSTFCIGK